MTNKICVYAICKNEEQFVDKWYESMKEADAIVVLDTGSTDNTVQKLRDHGVKVEVKEITPWRFDVARNESLKLVPDDCNILICTDLDEILHEGWSKPLREKWIEGVHTRACYKYIWSHTRDGAPGRIFAYNKIHDRHWIWKYPVHELLIDTTNNDTEHYDISKQLDLFDEVTLEHFPDPKKSRSSYLGLLEQRAQEYPEDCYGHIYLSHEYRYRGFYEKSNEALQHILEKFDKQIDSVERASCYLFMGDNYVSLNNKEEAIKCYLKCIETNPTYREGYINLAHVYNDMKEYDKAICYIKDAFANSYRHYSWLERDISWSYEPYDILCIAYYYTGRKKDSLVCALKALSYDKNNQRLFDNVKTVLNSIDDKNF